MSIPSPRRRASLVASPTPQSPASHIPRPQSASGHRPGSASGRYRSYTPQPTPIATPAPLLEANGADDPEKGQVRVVLRLRPSEPHDPTIAPRHRAVLVHPTSLSEVRVSVDPATLAGTTTIASTSKRHPTFTFDRVLGEQATQADLYSVTARDRIDEFLRGFNVTFLAYGQTSSGKSYSMGTTGEDSDYMDISDHSRVGLIPRTVDSVFRRAEEIRQASGAGASWECRVSFLELYNEDLIDLLSHTGTSVSIREGQDGRIVWSGVKEVKVSNVHEVMHLLREGSARRRTGETNMNLTSSRSHAIFSLTMVQTRRSDASDDVRSTPSKRPMSYMGSRSSTPVFSRVPPSSFSKLNGNRPSSMHMSSYGHDDQVIITSKFNMVDLAGSERLKRTAAQGERMKEGISINSGLLALGNVISALAEPAKNRGHIPYRDSKLTRLLQDSIGGNALTTMIACISPLEFNISETINTINYASRARRIKNTISKNQSEVGWDDIDHLRNTVTKLRTKIVSLEREGPRTSAKSADSAIDDNVLQRQVIDLSDKLADLEDDFSRLQDQYFQKCREIVALSDPETLEDDKLRQFNETIEPVVLEYEKVVTSLNGQLAELRAEAAVQLQAYEEQASDLSKTQDRLGEHESYVQELQGRIAKLTARSDSSEAYIRDLEVKFRTFTDNDDRHTEVIANLTQEIQQLKTESVKSNTYISQLEARVATADTRVAELESIVEQQEQEADDRDVLIRDFEKKLAIMNSNQPNINLLLAELETRERRISDLENKLVEVSEATPVVVATRDAGVDASHAAPSTPPDTPPALRTIAEDTESEVDLLRKENETLWARVREVEQRYEQLHHTPVTPATPALDAPSEQDEELEEEGSELGHNKRESTGNDSSESETTLETPKLASRTVSPQIQDDSSMARSPYGQFRAAEFRNSSRASSSSLEPRLLRPLSLSQGLSNLSYGSGSPRYSWSAPGNGLIPFERSPKRQSMPFDSKPMRSVQSLEIDISLLQKAVQDREAQLKQREVEIKYLKRTLEQGVASRPATSPLDPEVLDHLRKEHADELDKIYAQHSRSMSSLEEEHVAAIAAVQQQLEAASKKHALEMEELKASHSSALEDLDTRHRGELDESSGLKSALDAAWEELAATGRRHQTERDNLTATHHKDVADLEARHANVLETLRNELTASAASLKAVREELDAANEAKAKAERELSERPDVSTMIPMEEHEIVVSAMEEMEKALTAAEDEKRQLKMKADQVRFELSRIRDEHEVQRSSDMSRLADLEKRCSTLTSDNAELHKVAAELQQRQRDSKQMDRSSRTKLPPIGPPPTAPLPPLPAGREAVLSPTLTNASLPRGEGSIESARSSRYESHDGHSGTVRPDSVLAVIEMERDKAYAEREEAIRQAAEAEAKVQDMEVRYANEHRNNEQFTKDLIELRKNNSKLKVRVDDVNKELADLKRERDGLKRDVVEMKNELADAQYERIADRQRLEGARAEVAQYKAKLDRMVDAKVSKRSDQKLKCF